MLKRHAGSRPIEDLSRDMQDGVALVQLVEVLGKVPPQARVPIFNNRDFNFSQDLPFVFNRPPSNEP